MYIFNMKILQVGELKTKFSKVIEDVKSGEEITISYGKKHEKIAVIIPYDKYKSKTLRKLDILAGKATFNITDDFSISDETLLNS